MLFISSDNRLWLLQILYALLTSDLTQAILYDHGVKLDSKRLLTEREVCTVKYRLRFFSELDIWSRLYKKVIKVNYD